MHRSFALVFCLSFFGCNCGDEAPGGDVGDASTGDVGDSGFSNVQDTGPGSICIAEGLACDRATDTCCSGVCGESGVCAPPVFCAGPNEACTTGGECCSLRCTGGACSTQLCQSTGSPCASGDECCSTICGSGGTCEPVPGGPGNETCLTLGEACNDPLECCSTNCQGGVCVRAYHCQANGDICTENSECCGNVCSATATGTAGRCQLITGGGGGGCTQGGNPCPSGGSNCCSRVCVDVGTGAAVCQIAGGCRLTGSWCSSDNACCGGGDNPNGTVVCQSAPAGRCDNGQACNPVGNICGAPVLPGGGSINASQNCCDGKKEVCKLDSSGIPRCFGGCPSGDCDPNGDCPTGYDGAEPNCCIPEGDQCQFRDQCCGFRPCVPNELGVLVCADTPICLAVGETCTPGGNDVCCAGTACQQADPDSGLFACLPLVPPGPDAGVTPDAAVGDGGNDGGVPVDVGTPDTGVCSPNGVTCANGGECCSGICGASGTCEAPAQCQAQGALCSVAGDCCAGLDCIIAGGSTSGTCETGALCSNLSQSCSPNQACCGGLRCVQQGGLAGCDGTTACLCAVDL